HTHSRPTSSYTHTHTHTHTQTHTHTHTPQRPRTLQQLRYTLQTDIKVHTHAHTNTHTHMQPYTCRLCINIYTGINNLQIFTGMHTYILYICTAGIHTYSIHEYTHNHTHKMHAHTYMHTVHNA